MPPLVIAGRRGWKTEDVFDVINRDPDVNKQIIFLEGTSSASDEEPPGFIKLLMRFIKLL